MSRTLAIVGRPNVGKSALFNRLAGRRISIVHDQPGVTRDRIISECKLGDHPFTIVDTGGIGAGLDDSFSDAIHTEAAIAIETANVIAFVVDAREGVTPVDEMLASQLRKADRPVILVANKVDTPKQDSLASEFSSLGFREIVSTSAEHGGGIDELVEQIEAFLPKPELLAEAEKIAASQPVKFALIGRPNVGKSSIINALLGDERAIVSDVAGTTRDALDVPFVWGGQDYLLIDTAGLRQRNKRDTSVEVFSAMRTERSVRRADICAVVIDAAAGATQQDRRIAGAIAEQGKPCIVVANKFDLYHPDAKERDRIEILRDELAKDLFFLHYAPIVAISALKNENVGRMFREVEQVKHAARQEISTGKLNRLLHRLFEKNPPPGIRTKKNRRVKLLYATMAKKNDERPIPVSDFVMFVNEAGLLTDAYARYLENNMREEFNLTGIPIRLQLRDRGKAS